MVWKRRISHMFPAALANLSIIDFDCKNQRCCLILFYHLLKGLNLCHACSSATQLSVLGCHWATVHNITDCFSALAAIQLSHRYLTNSSWCYQSKRKSYSIPSNSSRVLLAVPCPYAAVSGSCSAKVALSAALLTPTA